MQQELLSLHQAATRKGQPPHTIQEAIDAGDLPAVYEGGWFVSADDLERWEPHPKTVVGSDFTDQEAAEYLRTSDTSR